MSSSKCMYCSSTAVGTGCPYGHKNIHVHPMNVGKCIYCLSSAIGAGCPYNPNDKVHVHGVDYNNMIKEALHNGITTGLLMRKLALPFIEWPAYKLGIINENGILLKKPNSIKEQAAFSNNDAYIAKLKRLLTETQIALINNSIYLSNSKENNNISAELIAENYTKELEIKQQIDTLINQLLTTISKSINEGIKISKIENMIIESINSK